MWESSTLPVSPAFWFRSTEQRPRASACSLRMSTTSFRPRLAAHPITQIIDGDRRFDFSVRYSPEFRNTPDAIGKILISTPDGNQVPLSAVADVDLRNGAFTIYHEGGRRYIPIKFSVRGRDLASAIQDLQQQLTEKVKLPTGYDYTWAGEFDSLRKEQKRLAIIIPVSVLIILILLYIQFRTWTDAFIIVGTLPFAAIGGVFTLFFTHTSFSISAAVGFTSLTGVATLGAVVFLSGIRRAQEEDGSGGRTRYRLSRRDASGRNGLLCRRPRTATRRRRHRDRRANSAAPGAGRGRRHGHHPVGYPVHHPAAGPAA